MGYGAIASAGLSAYPYLGVSLVNNLGQTLYEGNVVEIDFLQQAASSIPSAGNTANPGVQYDALNTGLYNGILATTNGYTLNTMFSVVSGGGSTASSSGIKPSASAKFLTTQKGFAKIQVDPNQQQIFTIPNTANATNTFTVAFNGQTAAGATYNVSNANLTTSLTAISSIGTGNAIVTGTVLGTAGGVLTVTFGPQIATQSAGTFSGSIPLMTIVQGTATYTSTSSTTFTNGTASATASPALFVAGVNLTSVPGHTFAMATNYGSNNFTGALGPELSLATLAENAVPLANSNNTGLYQATNVPATDPNTTTNAAGYSPTQYLIRAYMTGGLINRRNLGVA